MSRVLLLLSLLSFLSLGITKVRSSPFAYSCPNTSTYTPGSAYKVNINVLLSALSNAAGHGVVFQNSSAGGHNSPDTVYGLFLCRGDVSTKDCKDCVELAVTEIVEYCPSEKSAILYYDNCLLRYSNASVFSVLDESAPIEMHHPLNYTKSDPNRFWKVLGEIMNDTATRAAAGNKRPGFKFATKEDNVSNDQTLYGLSQCTPDLSSADCKKCLEDAISSLPVCCDMKQGGRYLFPSCNVRYELYPFYNLNATAPPTAVAPPPPPPDLVSRAGRDNRKARTIAISASVSASLVVALLAYWIYYQRRRKRLEKEDKENSQEVQLSTLAGGRFGVGENFEGDKQLKPEDFPSIKLEIIYAATRQFSEANKLGEGGFGQVYKGTLPDGKEIAVKRLSASSGQGFKEFKNEVTLIARLQHRNLVRLLGCCFEGNESLLIYEYMPNKSLDVFLFDPTRGTELDWKTRLSIINGIARGILYLHEDSRLRIIHRDLKASNILLDAEMNPKISDFGMARIFGGNQNQANTNRVVGTYGYMSPEYAMHGQFSVKSDVFSFGVLLLEIISGKKNGSLDLSEHGYSLLTYAWKLWSEGQELELLDPLIEQPCEADQAVLTKCIHIGLLCVQEDPANRPTMSSVVVMFGSHDTLTFPRPTQPAFSVGRPLPKSTDQFSSSSNNNQLTLSVVCPR